MSSGGSALAASWALQQALHARLSGTAALMAGLATLADDPPPDAPLPLLLLGDDVVVDWSTKSFAGTEHRLTLQLWTAAADRRRAKQLAAQIAQALASPPLVLEPGFTLVSFMALGARTVRDPNGRRTLALLDYRARIAAL